MDKPIPYDKQDKILMTLFVEKMKQELVDTAIAAIRPDIERAANNAIEELKPIVQQHFDARGNNLVFHLSIGKNP